MDRAFRAFVNGILQSVDTQDLQNSLAQFSAAFDLGCFAYLTMPEGPGVEAGLISTYPENWTKRYLAKHYERIDPVIHRAHEDPEPFEWGPTIGSRRISKVQQVFFDEAAEFGIRYGFTIPIHGDRGRMAAVTFAADETSPLFRRYAAEKSDVFQLSAMLFHARACRVHRGNNIVAGVPLSSRQLECLKWTARGKSATDIATILGISRRTVTFHIECAKAKLGVRTTNQAVALLSASRPVKH